MTPQSALAFALVSLIALAPQIAHAQQPTEKDQDAERLFREGQEKMAEKNFAAACPKFEAAYRKDQQLGTLLNLAYCHKEQGALWLSWLEFKDAELKAVELKKTDRKEFARQKMAELEKEKSLGRVVIDLPPASKAELSEVLVEDRRVPEAEKGVTFAAETGQRKFIFRAKGKKEKQQLVTITKSDKPQHVAVPDMVEDTTPAAVTPPPIENPPPHTDDPPRGANPPPDKGDGSSTKRLAVVAMGVGAVGLGVGAVTGIMTLSNECSGTVSEGCTQEKHDSANSTALVSTLAFGVGILAGGGGLILYLMSSPDSKPTTGSGITSKSKKNAGAATTVTPDIGLGWLGVRGRF